MFVAKSKRGYKDNRKKRGIRCNKIEYSREQLLGSNIMQNMECHNTKYKALKLIKAMKGIKYL